MHAIINNGKNNNLHCNVDCEVGNYQDQYNSPGECYNDIKEDIQNDCKEREYTEAETEKVLNHYQILLSNSAGEWKDINF